MKRESILQLIRHFPDFRMRMRKKFLIMLRGKVFESCNNNTNGLAN